MMSIKRVAYLRRPRFAAAALPAICLLLSLSDPGVAQVTGSGTQGKVTKWTGATTLGDSVITESATGNVGIGASSPNFKLEVAGHVAGKASQPAFWLFDTAGTADQRQFYFWNSSGIILGRWVNDANSAVVSENVSFKANGNVGFGTINPIYKVDLFGATASQFHITNSGTDSGLYLLSAGADNAYLSGGAAFNGAAWIAKASNAQLFGQSNGSFVFYSNTGLTAGNSFTPTERVRIENNGFVGIGTAAPTTPLHIKTKDAVNTLVIDSGLSAPNFSEIAFFDRGLYKWELVKTVDNQFGIYDSPVGIYRLYIRNDGKVGIGTTSPSTQLHVVGDMTLTGSGNITASGTITGGNVVAKYQDIAEWVPSRTALSAGTVVVLDTEHSNQVMASSTEYDTRVAGVVSARPGVILGESGEGKVMIATTGRVRVRVDATSAPIRVGDLLVTGSKAGIAMRSQPLVVGGTRIHRPGTLIGKALEPLEKGVGEILVLLSLQ